MNAKISGIGRYVGLFMLAAKKPHHNRVLERPSNGYLGIYIVLLCTYAVVIAAAILLVMSVQLSDSAIAGFVCAAAFLYNAAVHLLLYLEHRHAASYLLLLFYIVLAGGIMWVWGGEYVY